MLRRTKYSDVPTAILTSDWHLREDVPICRIDDYWTAQWRKVDYVSALQKRFDCIVIHAGDLFDKWKPSPYLLRQTILHIPNKFYTVYGQHDLPQHSLELVDKCGINVLQAAGKLRILDTCHYGQEPNNPSFILHPWSKGKREILVWHHLTYITKPFPGASGGMAEGLLRKYPEYDLMLTGDNHATFTATYKNHLLVNPGSLMRMDADQINHKPSVFLWYAKTNTFQQVFLPIEEGVVSREHLEKKKQRDKRIDAFINTLNVDYEHGVSFEDNIETFLKKNTVKQEVKSIIYKSIQ